MTQLPIPYRSQWDPDAASHAADCGPTCVAMILNYFGVDITPDGVYKHLPPKKAGDFTFFNELISATLANQVNMAYARYESQGEALGRLKGDLDAGRPVLALVKYAPWKQITGNQFDWGHFVVVTGYDGDQITVHDPLFGMWQQRSKGAHLAFTESQFCAGWGGFNSQENPNWACAVASGTTARPAPSVTAKEAAPTPAVSQPQPTPAATATAVAEGELTPEIQRRIRALAAYRWAEEPDWTNPQEVRLWLDHLGDFGQEVDHHTVAAGETLSALASRFYGEQHRWPAIKAFNRLQREGLWLGERLQIPRRGQSGAHLAPELPHDTKIMAGTLSSDEFTNPDQPPLDYNALGANTVGMGFMNEPGTLGG